MMPKMKRTGTAAAAIAVLAAVTMLILAAAGSDGTVDAYGRVVNAETGEAIPGATVTVAQTGDVTSSATGGGFVVTVPVEESFTLRAEKKGYEAAEQTLYVPLAKVRQGVAFLTPIRLVRIPKS